MACTLPTQCHYSSRQSAEPFTARRTSLRFTCSLQQQRWPLCARTRRRPSPQNLTSRSPVQTRGQRLRVLALGTEELAQGIDKGSRVRVKGELIIYHSPKLGASFNLEGKEGTVLDIVQQYKGEKLSANLPYKVEFMIPVEDSKDVKLIAHLASTEIEAA